MNKIEGIPTLLGFLGPRSRFGGQITQEFEWFVLKTGLEVPNGLYKGSRYSENIF